MRTTQRTRDQGGQPGADIFPYGGYVCAGAALPLRRACIGSGAARLGRCGSHFLLLLDDAPVAVAAATHAALLLHAQQLCAPTHPVRSLRHQSPLGTRPDGAALSARRTLLLLAEAQTQNALRPVAAVAGRAAVPLQVRSHHPGLRLLIVELVVAKVLIAPCVELHPGKRERERGRGGGGGG